MDMQPFSVHKKGRFLLKSQDFNTADNAVEIGFAGIGRFGQGAYGQAAVFRILQTGGIDTAVAGSKPEILDRKSVV